MAYSDFKLPDLKRRFHLIFEEDVDLFTATSELPVSEWLRETLHETLSIALAVTPGKYVPN